MGASRATVTQLVRSWGFRGLSLCSTGTLSRSPAPRCQRSDPHDPDKRRDICGDVLSSQGPGKVGGRETIAGAKLALAAETPV